MVQIKIKIFPFLAFFLKIEKLMSWILDRNHYLYGESALISLGKEYPVHGGILVKKSWPLKAAFNQKLLKFAERGMLDGLTKVFRQSKPKPFNQLKFKDIFTSFLSFGFAIVCCLIVFLLEKKMYIINN